LHANENEQVKKQQGRGESYLERESTVAVGEGGGDRGGVFLPSLLSPMFLFLAPSPLFFSVIFFFSPLSLQGRQRRSVGVLWRWRGSTVAAVVVLLL